ncbi:hypothetical protein HD806DRAFT_538519 [Xylariaceae sp. AK1471]|nr:hypothetical protein HD806DRAFT_538519 [Xylariaceae sp. AK1471]
MDLPQATLSPPAFVVASESIGVVATNIESVEGVAERLHVARNRLLGYGGLLKSLYDVIWGYRIALITLSTFRGIGASELHAPLEVNVRARGSGSEMNRPKLLDDTEPFAMLYPQGASREHGPPSSSHPEEVQQAQLGVLTGSVAYGFTTTAGTVGTVGFFIPLSIWATG